LTQAAKLPERPPDDLAPRAPEWVSWATARPLSVVASSAGPHAHRFGVMRSFAPVRVPRFDPHPEPPGTTSGELVLYDVCDLVTAIAERYKHRRAVHLADPDEPVVYSWHPTRTLRMIDLAGPGAHDLSCRSRLLGALEPAIS